MNYYQTIIIILMIFNILLGVDAWWLAKQCNKADRKVKELDEELAKEKANNRFVMPVAEVNAQFSEEDMKKIKELLNNVKPGTVKLGEPEEAKCECDHLYETILLVDDPIQCREKLIFHCGRCNHEVIVPVKKGVMKEFVIFGGKR